MAVRPFDPRIAALQHAVGAERSGQSPQRVKPLAIAVDALVLIEAEKNPALGVSPETKILQNRRN